MRRGWPALFRIRTYALLFGLSCHSKLYVTRTLRKFDVVTVVGFYLASIRAGRERFVQNVRQTVNTLVDVVVLRRRTRRTVSVDAEFVIGSFGVSVPFHFYVGGADFRAGLRTQELQIVLEKMRVGREECLALFDLVLGRLDDA